MEHTRKNWAGVNIWHPQKVAYPATAQKLRQTILTAKAKRMKIRVAGSLHSYMCETSGVQLHTDKLCKVLSVDKAQMRVKVEGGMKIRHLVKYLAKQGLALPNQGYIVRQSIAGGISTATHGTGKTGTLSSFVEEIELMDADGKMHTLNPRTSQHLFNAAVVSLGCLGVIYSVTLKCIPFQNLELSMTRSTLAPTLKDLSHLLSENDYFQFLVDPYTDQLLRWAIKKTGAQRRNVIWGRINWFLRKWTNIFIVDYIPLPNWLKRQLISKLYLPFITLKGHVIDYCYRILSPDDEPTYVEEEIAVPIEHFESALADMRKIVDEFCNKNGPIVIAQAARFVEADVYGYLSPTLSRKSVYLVSIARPKTRFKELYRQLEQALLKYNGRPHWGKIHTLTRDTAKKLYGENFTRFVEARKTLDPEGLFLNETLEKIFGA